MYGSLREDPYLQAPIMGGRVPPPTNLFASLMELIGAPLSFHIDYGSKIRREKSQLFKDFRGPPPREAARILDNKNQEIGAPRDLNV